MILLEKMVYQTNLLSMEKQVWRMGVNELKRVKELEGENAKLKRMYADLAIMNEALKDVIEKKLSRPARKKK